MSCCISDEAELMDLVDAQDRVIGQLSREEIYAQGLRNYRVILAFLVNDEGKPWIPRRTAYKTLFPNALDYSVGGHVAAGESYEEALRRETAEELSIDLSGAAWRELGKRTPADGAHCFQAFYEIRSNATPNWNLEDFSEAFWLHPQAALEKIRSEEIVKDDLAPAIERFYL